MYTIYVDDTLLYSPERVQDGYVITAGKLTREVNKADSLDITVPGSNPGLASLVMMGSRIIVFRDDDVVFIGRALTAKRGLYNLITYHCEGGLAYFNDAPAPTIFGADNVLITPKSRYDRLLDRVPVQVTSSGTVYGDTFLDTYIPHYVPHIEDVGNSIGSEAPAAAQGKYIRRKTSGTGYDQTYVERMTDAVSQYGGTFTVEYTNSKDTFDFERDAYFVIFHWYAPGNEPLNPQIIRFARNLLDISYSIDYSGLKTVYYPTGIVQADNLSKDVIIYPPTSGTGICKSPGYSGMLYEREGLYMPDASAVETYGFLVEIVEFDLSESYDGTSQILDNFGYIDFNSSEYQRLQTVLLDRITEYAAAKIGAGITFECNAVDLSLVDDTQTPLCVGQRNRIISDPNSIDTTVLCSRTEIDLLDPTKSRYTFGTSSQVMSSLLRPNSGIGLDADITIIRNKITSAKGANQ